MVFAICSFLSFFGLVSLVGYKQASACADPRLISNDQSATSISCKSARSRLPGAKITRGCRPPAHFGILKSAENSFFTILNSRDVK